MVRQQFGASWTEEKLGLLSKYLPAYTTALKNKDFQLIYIDAFAGTGQREANRSRLGGLLDAEEFQNFQKGSVRIALECIPPFSRFVFIEKSRAKAEALKTTLQEYPKLLARAEVRQNDANSALMDICRKTDWRRSRAVAFLDPFGMQVDWPMIEAIARTRAMDMWYLFPSHMGVIRMLVRSGNIPQSWQSRLDRCLGEPGWRRVFYEAEQTTDLFGERSEQVVRRVNTAAVEAYFRDRLATVFPGVGKRAVPLQTLKGNCLYLLFFACANPAGSKVALRIANDIMRY